MSCTSKISVLQEARKAYQPKLPGALKSGKFAVKELSVVEPPRDADEIKALFPNTFGKPMVQIVAGDGKLSTDAMNVGVVLSGGPAPGGHNCIAGLYDALMAVNPASKLYGFLSGPKGVFTGKYVEITAEMVDDYRNTGGFDMIGSGRDKIETDEQVLGCVKVLKELGCKALVIIGGDDSNTNGAVLAEAFAAKGEKLQVIGLPKTIDGDMRNEHIEASFGFDTAAKTFSQLVSNVCRDSASARKYYHFIKLMGRSASHVALEVALQVQPTITLISEEIQERNLSLNDIVNEICRVIAERAAKGLNYGVIVIPEGLLQFVNEFKSFFKDLEDLMRQHIDAIESMPDKDKYPFVTRHLPPTSSALYASLPVNLQDVLLRTDSHGNLTVSQLETEVFLIDCVKKKLDEMAKIGSFQGKFAAQPHFFGYEGRCGQPSNFDADYCYSLGYAGVQLIRAGLTGYTVSAQNLDAPADEWVLGGIPVSSMLHIEIRKGQPKPVIEKCLVDLKGGPFQAFVTCRDEWKAVDAYKFVGPVQYWGPAEVCDAPTITLELEGKKRKAAK
ncbi:diphosphate--fructose-6-phosphate 1-phosphotransferase [Candidatus Sumerlaeota bacterium]|nr:diphosphate--fructose-6-phosphate 1-phosphotransferase [Candidatus Sumerlaeales bacterium]NLD61486.1 diphosphate--fructose-6-phosphate 1-phosphotransferase [Candidatus Sumerlaeota bacterium]